MTDDRFDDYVDEESVSDFVADDVDSGSEVDAHIEGHAGIEGEPDTELLPDFEMQPDFEVALDADPVTSAVSKVDLPEPGVWTQPAATGVASVDAAIEELARLDALPTSEHVAVYEGVHRQLQDALADLDGS